MDELVSLRADQASINLADQVEALARARKKHETATANVQATLADLEVKVEKAKGVTKKLNDQRNKLITAMCIKECDREEKQEHVHRLKKEIREAAAQKVNLTSQIKLKEMEKETSRKTVQKCMEKMDAYKSTVERFERNLPEMTELEQARQKAKTLQEERDKLHRELNLLSGSREENWEEVLGDIRRDIQDLETSLQKRNLLVEKLESKLQDRQRERQKLETDNMILKNRNSALLIRLKRQAETQRTRFEHLTNHVLLTEERLNSSKARLKKLNEH